MNGSTTRVIEEWRVIDRWWTNDPTQREFREVERDGRRFVEKRESLPLGGWSEWEEVEAR